MEKGSIRALARKVFASTRRSISPYDICLAYCKDHGWHVVLMGDGGHGDKVLELLGLSEYARGKRAFCYRGLTTQIIAVDILPSRLQLAQERGYADLGIDAAADDVEARILDATGGLGADAVIECAGGHDTFQTAWKVARPNATVAVVAMYEEAQSLPLHLMYGKNLTFRTGGVDATHSAELIRLIERGRIDTNPLITHSLPLNKILEGYRIFEQRQDDCIKCAITPWKR